GSANICVEPVQQSEKGEQPFRNGPIRKFWRRTHGGRRSAPAH
ncbi:unnamed protein product, partial [Allacma fusca]